MTKIFLFFISLSLISFCQAAKSFNFWIYASEWRGSVCELRKCDQTSADKFWNIHGLWPSDGSKGLSSCSTAPFSKSDLKTIQTDLDAYWSGLYNSEEKFHLHEWDKHGTCSGMQIQTYFATVLNISHHLDIYGTLEKNGIVPGHDYDCKKITNVIRSTYNITNFFLMKKSGRLAEIRFCLDMNLKPIDCAKSEFCKGNIAYPAFNSTNAVIPRKPNNKKPNTTGSDTNVTRSTS